ncbi:hypothetical protein MTR67_007623 [Solanum verrucosum]|uniref:Uncharacterized protein n=1 Tax=Solanum verrucosum TaxID=315347 RepID=A0AAF0Q0J9_SOLVR|nr:hypothetical protein MTR67_007623 [Solanum verrucosum]
MVVLCNVIQNRLVSNVQTNQDNNLNLVELKKTVSEKAIEAFSLGGDGILHYQGCLCLLNFDELRQLILSEAHSSRYSIHLGATKMYCDIRKVY